MYLMDNESTDYGSHDLQVCMLDHTIVFPHNSLATAHDYDVVMCNNIECDNRIAEIHYRDMIQPAIIVIYNTKHLSFRITKKF